MQTSSSIKRLTDVNYSAITVLLSHPSYSDRRINAPVLLTFSEILTPASRLPGSRISHLNEMRRLNKGSDHYSFLNQWEKILSWNSYFDWLPGWIPHTGGERRYKSFLSCQSSAGKSQQISWMTARTTRRLRFPGRKTVISLSLWASQNQSKQTACLDIQFIFKRCQ